MNNINHILLSFLTRAVSGRSAQTDLEPPLSEEEVKSVYELAKKHDLAHLIGVAVETVSSEEKTLYKPFLQESVKAMYRYEWLKGEFGKICALFDEHRIPDIPLKGAIIRELYKEPWHRTSCDIDILIPQERLGEACALFETELSYTQGKHSLHDVSMTAPNGVHLELHFDIDEVYIDCNEFWKDAKPAADDSCRYILSAEMLLLSHIAHMAKHFVNGGCGLRPFLDLWLMREKLSYDHTNLLKMLERHDLEEFSRAVFGIVDVWFNGKTANEIEQMVESFILPAGVYGDLNNKITVTRAKGKNKYSYAVERIFPPCTSLKIAYPILNKHPWLLPICWVRRWIRLLSAGKLKQVKIEYHINYRLNADQLNNTDKMLKLLGLNT